MQTLTLRLLLAVIGLSAALAWFVVPHGIHAARLVAAADDPERLADLSLDGRFDADIASREVEAALAAEDAELAASFVALADERNVTIAPELRARVAAAHETAASFIRTAGRFAEGFVSGEPDDLATLAGTVTGDLFVFGDLRDAARETTRMVRGEKVDELILGLACVGLAITAGTYASLGAGAPARVGVSVIKAAGKTGRLSARLTEAVVRPLRGALDTAALKSAFGSRAWLQPAVAVRGIRDAVKIEKAQGVVRLVEDIGRVQSKAGTRAALDSVRLADSPKDVARLARLADAKGGKTRAVLKLLGRGAIVLGVGLFNLASWMFWALMSVLGLCAALKRFAERTTLRYLRWRKSRRARLSARDLELAPSPT